MSVVMELKIVAPAFVTKLNKMGINILSRKQIITEASLFELPSGNKASLYDEDYGPGLYGCGDQSMCVPYLEAMSENEPMISWLLNNLMDAQENRKMLFNIDDEEEFEDDDYNKSFCTELRALIEKHYPGESCGRWLRELDRLIEEAEYLHLEDYGDGDFHFTYLKIKNGKRTYKSGSGSDKICQEWSWKNLAEFKNLVQKY